jgi:hypothetical protein
MTSSSPQPDAAGALYPLLLGDRSLDEWPDGELGTDPWSLFVSARSAFRAGTGDAAARIWRSIAARTDVESRHVLQAWTFLRLVGMQPSSDEAETVHGVVCEVPVDGGHDVLAAYRDGSSRYLNYTGSAVVVDQSPPAAVRAARTMIEAAAPVAQVVGTWDDPVLPELPSGHARLLLLTPGGFRFGQGPPDSLWSDPGAAAVLDAATALLQLITTVDQS